MATKKKATQKKPATKKAAVKNIIAPGGFPDDRMPKQSGNDFVSPVKDLTHEKIYDDEAPDILQAVADRIEQPLPLDVPRETAVDTQINVLARLERPIAFIDIETTTAEITTAKIIEISILKLFPDGTEEIKTRRINPGMDIPAASTAVHGITDEMVKGEPFFYNVAKAVHEFIVDCDIAGFRSNKFDCPILFYEFQRAGVDWKYRHVDLIDVGIIYTIQEPRTLAAAYKFYTGMDLENAHSAEADIKATKEIFIAQLAKYPELPKTIKELAVYSNYGKPILDISGKFSLDADGDVVFTFGSHIGKKAKGQRDFLDWMLKKDFTEDTKAICRIVLYGKKPTT